MKKVLSIAGNTIDVIISVVIYVFVTTFLSALDPASVTNKGAGGFDISLWLALGVTFFLLFSLMRFSVLFDREMRERFFSDGDGIYSPSEHIRYLFSFRKTYIGLGTALLVFFTVNTERLSKPIFDLFIKTEPNFLYKLLLLPIFSVIIFAIYYFASRSAARYWYEDRKRMHETKMKYTLPTRISKMIVMVIAYTFGASLLANLTYRVSSVFLNNSAVLLSSKVLWMIYILFVVFVIVPYVSRQLGAIFKRRKFIKNLTAVCDKYNCSLSKIRRPYASLFRLKSGYDFDFEHNGKKYACKMLYSKHKLRPMTFFDGGMGAHETIINVKRTELFRIRSWFEYSFEADAKKLLIINPIPKKLMINDHGRVALIDNGDSIAEYKIYSATALVNAIDRNTLER